VCSSIELRSVCDVRRASMLGDRAAGDGRSGSTLPYVRRVPALNPGATVAGAAQRTSARVPCQLS